MRKMQIIMGSTIEEKLASVDTLLAKMCNGSNGRQIVNNFTFCPLMKELFQKDIAYPIILTAISGTLRNIIVFIENTNAKKMEISVNILTNNQIRSIKVPVKNGFNSSSIVLIIENNTLVTVSYSMEEGVETTPPLVGFTYEKKEIANVSSPQS